MRGCRSGFAAQSVSQHRTILNSGSWHKAKRATFSLENIARVRNGRDLLKTRAGSGITLRPFAGGAVVAAPVPCGIRDKAKPPHPYPELEPARPERKRRGQLSLQPYSHRR